VQALPLGISGVHRSKENNPPAPNARTSVEYSVLDRMNRIDKIADRILMANMRKPIMEIMSILSIIYPRSRTPRPGVLDSAYQPPPLLLPLPQLPPLLLPPPQLPPLLLPLLLELLLQLLELLLLRRRSSSAAASRAASARWKSAYNRV
jgi:hypothetical protein